MNEDDKELLSAYAYVDDALQGLMYLARHRIPFEEWPKELQAIAGVNPELCGPSTKPIRVVL